MEPTDCIPTRDKEANKDVDAKFQKLLKEREDPTRGTIDLLSDTLCFSDDEVAVFLQKTEADLAKIRTFILQTKTDIYVAEETQNSLKKAIAQIEELNNTFVKFSTDRFFAMKPVYDIAKATSDAKQFLLDHLAEVTDIILDKNESVIRATNKRADFLRLVAQSQDIKYDKNTCVICMVEPVNTCLNPCGHTFCKDCTIKTRTCGLCRAPIQDRIKIHLNFTEEEKLESHEISPAHFGESMGEYI